MPTPADCSPLTHHSAGDHPPEDLLLRWREGRLGAEERAALAPHLDHCEHCQARLDQPDSQLAAFAQQALPSPPPIPRYQYVLNDHGFPRVLGYGGQGVVFLARYEGLAGTTLRAVKVLHTGFRITPRARERFRREVEAITELGRQGHPGFVQVYDCDESGGCLYYVMEYVPGGTLQRYLQRGLPTPRQAAEWLLQLTEAMVIAHGNGIFHRDLKPSNVLLLLESVAREARPSIRALKIADFSHVRLVDHESSLTQGEPVGTPNYMAPEQVRGEPVDARADVYGLCAILYEMLTGVPPYKGPSAQATMEMVRSPAALPARPESLRPELARAANRDLASICMRGLDKERGRRYVTVDALAEDVRRYLHGEATRARPVGRAERIGRLCRRHPMPAGLIGLLVVVLLVGFGGILYQWNQAEEERHKAEVAGQEAEAGEAEAEELLGDLVQSSQTVRRLEGFMRGGFDLERLCKIELQCQRLLAKRPQDTRLRIALTSVLGGLAELLLSVSRPEEADTYLARAHALWEPLALAHHDRDSRFWLATTLLWQARSAASQGQFERILSVTLDAESLWVELNEEQPDDPAILQRAVQSRQLLADQMNLRAARGDLILPLEKSRSALERAVGEEPSDRRSRNRLALTWFLLGELHRINEPAEAARCWREAVEQYQRLAEGRSDLFVQLPLAWCGRRLLATDPASPGHEEAVVRLEQAAAQLRRLGEQYPKTMWLLQTQLATQFSVTACYWKRGETTRAEVTFQQQVQQLDHLLEAPTVEFSDKVRLILLLRDMGVELRENDRREAALKAARAATVRLAALTESPARDLGSCYEIASASLVLAALLCQLEQPGEGLEEARRALHLFEGLHQAMPELTDNRAGISSAWARIAKAQEQLGRAEEALAAIRKSIEAERWLFEREPSSRLLRITLGRLYDLLLRCAARCGHWAEARTALQEREKLRGDEVNELKDIAQDYLRLADAITNGNNFGPAEHAERQRCRDESVRLMRTAEEMAGRARNDESRSGASAKR